MFTITNAGMLIGSLLILFALRVNGLSHDEQGPRRTKQLDLQNIQSDLTTTLAPLDKNDEVINGYLPPAPPSSSSVPNFVSSQSQQSFDFKSVNSGETDSEQCNPSINQVSCNLKNNSSSESEILKPSRDLTPPFNDLEQEVAFPTNTTKEQLQESKTTEEPPKKLITTTEKPVTKSLNQAPTQISLNKVKSPTSLTASAKAFPSKTEASNDLKSYLPPQPEFSAAAQTNVAVVQPARPNNNNENHHDHHHGHHHGENFNICNDAFHSFLCAPLKARKRITGAFPSSLRGQSSFINYQKFLPNFEREPASSNTFQNAYLPPKRVSSSSNQIQSTLLPLPTTKNSVVFTSTAVPSGPLTKTTPGPSTSNNRVYLPPLSSSNIAPGPSRVPGLTFPAFKPSTPKPAVISTTLTAASNTFTNPSYSQAPLFPSPGNSRPAVFNSLPSNENKFYLPPNPNIESSASFTSTSKSVYPTNPTKSSQPVVFASQKPSLITTFGPLPSNSIFNTEKSKPHTVFSVLSTTARPFIKQEEPKKTTSSTFVTKSSPNIQISTRAPQTSNSVPFVSKPPKHLESSKRPYSSFKFTEESSNEDKSYLPPDPKEPAAAQINSETLAAPQIKNPFHHGRDLCTDPFHSFLCVNAKPRKRITGQLPLGFTPESSNTDESKLTPESSYQDENKVRPDKPLESASTQDAGYNYSKPNSPLPTFSNIIPSSTVSSSTGYSYPKPDKIFPQSSQQNFQFVGATSSTKAKPELRPSEAKIATGYQYLKPNSTLPLPTVQNQVTSSTNLPTTGYSYPKPQKPFPLPTEQKESRQKPKQKLPSSQVDLASPTNQVKGYQYPKPEQSLNFPENSGSLLEKNNGYSYPKPTKQLELPTENRTKLSQTNPSINPVGALGSAEFIPVNKLNFKRSESKLVAGLRRFGERQKKRLREAQTTKKHGE